MTIIELDNVLIKSFENRTYQNAQKPIAEKE
jgi:hypothetical protein